MAEKRQGNATSKPASKPSDSTPSDNPSQKKKSKIVGRLRSYGTKQAEFDPTSPKTPEGRLVDPEHPAWHVPSGQEAHLRKRSTVRTRRMHAGDVGKFRVSDFLTKASDERGHQKSLDIPMPEQMVNELQAICDANVFPARNLKSLARTLIYEGLEWLHELARQHDLEIPKSHMHQLEEMAVVNRDLGATLAYDDMLEQHCDLARELVRRGVRNKARVSVMEMLTIVDKITSRELRERWRRQIETEFAMLLVGRPAKIHKGRTAEPPTVDPDDDWVPPNED